MQRNPASLVFFSSGSPADHYVGFWIICIALTILLVSFVVFTAGAWKPVPGKSPRKFETERAEKLCDAVLGVCALLIPATLGLLTWLHEKVAFGAYVVPLAFALAYFFALLIFTAHLRFNFLLRYDKDFEVVLRRSMRFAYWLTMATSSIVLGLFLLAMPVLGLGFGWLRVKEEAPKANPIAVECNCKSANVTPPAAPPQHPMANSHRRRPKSSPAAP